MQKHTMEEVWRLHTDAEFMRHDVEGALATMTDDTFVMNMPTGMGGRGKNEVRAFYSDSFINSLPDDITGVYTYQTDGLDFARCSANQQKSRNRHRCCRVLL